jgi:hypothetical protein
MEIAEGDLSGTRIGITSEGCLWEYDWGGMTGVLDLEGGSTLAPSLSPFFLGCNVPGRSLSDRIFRLPFSRIHMLQFVEPFSACQALFEK